MPRKPDEYAVHIFLASGHTEAIRFTSVKEFQKWYSNQLIPKHDSDEFINIPIQNLQGEYMVLRPSQIIGIRVEPIFLGSVDRTT